jgi:hypothetical protein
MKWIAEHRGTNIVPWPKNHVWRRRSTPEPLAIPAAAIAVIAIGALAIATLAIGSLAIGRMAAGRVRIKKLTVDDLTVRRLNGIEQVTPME